MPHVQIRNVPQDVHATLARRAEHAGQSLQQYLSVQLELLASTPTLDEVLDRIERNPKGRLSTAEVIAALDESRARR